MKTMKYLILLAISASLLLFSGCMDLSVDNPNNPDTERALGEPSDVESLVGSQYFQWWNGTQKNYPGMTMAVMSGVSTSSWGNFGMFDLGAVPRQAFNNDAAYADRFMSSTPWSNLYTSISSSIDGIVALEGGLNFGPDDEDNRAVRMETFARFVMGISYGQLANHFDRGFIVDENTDFEALALGEVTLDAVDYEELLAFGIAQLDIAIALAESNSFTLPSGWVRGNALTSQQLASLAKAYKARFIVSNARSTQQRDAINWTMIRDLTGEVVNANPSFFNNDDNALNVEADGELWWSRPHSLMQDATWHRPFYPLIGRYDTSGGFDDWINTPLNNINSERREFIMTSADLRITGLNDDGEPDPAVNGSDFRIASAGNFPAERGLWRRSRYNHFRNNEMYINNFIGPMQHMRFTEIKMYHAEALLRLNAGTVPQAAADLINETRVERGGLEPITTASNPDYAFNAMRYEFHIETYATAAGLEFYNVRGQGNWRGDDYGKLITGTPLMFPIPASELELLQMDIYTFGGGGEGSAPREFNSKQRTAESATPSPVIQRAIDAAGGRNPNSVTRK